MCCLQQVQAQSAASSSGGYTPRSEASTSVAGTPNTPWQEEAALQVSIPDVRGDCIVVPVCGNTHAVSLSPMRAGTIHWSCLLFINLDIQTLNPTNKWAHTVNQTKLSTCT